MNNYTGMNYNELRSLAAERNLNQGRNPKKEELIKLLKEEMMFRNSRILIAVVSVVSVLALACGCLWLAGTAFYAGRRTAPDLIAAETGNTEQETETERELARDPEPTTEPTVAPAEEEKVNPLPSHGDKEPQPQVGHPSLYVETGTEGTRTWTLEASADEVIIAGGVTVNGRGEGVYKAYQGPTEIELTVTNGFALVVVEEWAFQEFCFRVGQAEQFNWAHEHVEPLNSWGECD